MNLPTDMIWETIKNVRYEDISNLCRTNRQFSEICRTPQAQQFFRTLQEQYRQRKEQERMKYIEDLVNEFEEKEKNDIMNFFGSSGVEEWRQLALSMVKNYHKQYPQANPRHLRIATLWGPVKVIPAIHLDPLTSQFYKQVTIRYLSMHPEVIHIIRNWLNRMY